MWNFFHFVSIWQACLESAHQLLHLLHLEKIVLILFPRYRQNLHRFYKVKISPFLVVCLLDIYLTTFCLGGGWGGFAWQGSWRRRRHSGQTIPPQMQKKSYHFTLKLFIQPFRSTNLPWKKLPGKDRGLKFPRLSGRIFYLTISLKSQKTKLIW